MAVPLYAIARDALAAELHVQLEVVRVDIPERMPGHAVIHGVVARVFRGEPSLVGTSLTIEEACQRPGDLVGPGGGHWLVAALERAKVIETYVHRTENGFRTVGTRLVDSVTDAPTHVFTEADAEPPSAGRSADLGWISYVLFVAAGLAGFGYAIWVVTH